MNRPPDPDLSTANIVRILAGYGIAARAIGSPRTALRLCSLQAIEARGLYYATRGVVLPAAVTDSVIICDAEDPVEQDDDNTRIVTSNPQLALLCRAAALPSKEEPQRNPPNRDRRGRRSHRRHRLCRTLLRSRPRARRRALLAREPRGRLRRRDAGRRCRRRTAHDTGRDGRCLDVERTRHREGRPAANRWRADRRADLHRQRCHGRARFDQRDHDAWPALPRRARNENRTRMPHR